MKAFVCFVYFAVASLADGAAGTPAPYLPSAADVPKRTTNGPKGHSGSEDVDVERWRSEVHRLRRSLLL